jgi:hypothetical protein
MKDLQSPLLFPAKRCVEVGAVADVGGTVGPRRLPPRTVEGLSPLLEGQIEACTPILNRPGRWVGGWLGVGGGGVDVGGSGVLMRHDHGGTGGDRRVLRCPVAGPRPAKGQALLYLLARLPLEFARYVSNDSISCCMPTGDRLLPDVPLDALSPALPALPAFPRDPEVVRSTPAGQGVRPRTGRRRRRRGPPSGAQQWLLLWPLFCAEQASRSRLAAS